MDIGEARKHYIFTCRIDLDDGDYIVLREPTSLELKEFGKESKANIELLLKIFPSAIVEHSFTDNGNPAKATQVAAILQDSGSLFTEIMNTWMESIPLSQKKSKK